MSEFELHKYSGMAYESNQIITFSENPSMALPDVDEEMKFHTGVSSIQVSNLTQKEFDYFIEKYGDNYESIYFFDNTRIKDLSALSKLKKVKYLLFWGMRANSLWNMCENENLLGVMISESKKLIYNLEPLQFAPKLEELLLSSSTFNKYPVKTISPLRNCKKLKRLFIEFNTEDKSFSPEDFDFLDEFKYQCDRKRNFTY
jgi:hypothetical protein